MSLSIIFFIIAACCNALMDTIQFHWYKFRWKDSVNADYWNPAISWRNKYIDNDPKKGLRFKGLFGWMSNFLDAWHLFKMIMIISFALSVIFFPLSFQFCITGHYYINGLIWMIILGLAWNIPFNLCFNHLFVKN